MSMLQLHPLMWDEHDNESGVSSVQAEDVILLWKEKEATKNHLEHPHYYKVPEVGQIV